MSIGKIARLITGTKTDKAGEGPEDPQEALENSYQRQLDMLMKLARGVADVAESRNRLEAHISKLLQEQQEMANQGRLAADHQTRRRKEAVDKELSDLVAQQEALQADEENLTVAHQRLQVKVEAFRVQKEAIKASYAAAEAESRFGDVWSSLSEEMGNEGLAAIPYQQQREALAQLLASIRKVSASREHLDRHINILRQLPTELEDRARQAFGRGREDLARQAFAQKAEIEGQLADLTAQSQSLQADEDKLTAGYERLVAEADRLRTYSDAAPAAMRGPGERERSGVERAWGPRRHDPEARGDILAAED